MRAALRGSLERLVRRPGGEKTSSRRVASSNRRFCVTRAVAERPCRVLGIESSCDDTGVAVVSSEGTVIAEALATQGEIHAPWGGVVPRLAQQAHQNVMQDLIESVMQESKTTAQEIDAVAVTVGPGLSLCLRVGVEAAMKLSTDLSIPLIPIHHMEAHALLVRMQETVQFPFLCLLVSGGHNLLLVVHNVGVYTQIGTTVDDSLGEAYDKVARMLDLDMVPSGGAALEAEAKCGDPLKYSFKLPMQKYRNCDFSYSGLKTAVRMAVDKEKRSGPLSSQTRADIAASFQHVAVNHLEDKCKRGIQWAMEHVPSLSRQFVISGGVASNACVRERLANAASEFGMNMACPPPRLCTDNGVMVAWSGIERYLLGYFDEHPVRSRACDGCWVDLRPRWPLTDRLAFSKHNQRLRERKRKHTSLTTMTQQGMASLTILSSSSELQSQLLLPDHSC